MEIELKECIEGMTQASNQFYKQAIKLNNHAFIEFTGLMNEYIKVCEDLMKKGIDFRFISQHNSQEVEMGANSLRYIEEKLNCIFKPFVEVILLERTD